MLHLCRLLCLVWSHLDKNLHIFRLRMIGGIVCMMCRFGNKGRYISMHMNYWLCMSNCLVCWYMRCILRYLHRLPCRCIQAHIQPLRKHMCRQIHIQMHTGMVMVSGILCCRPYLCRFHMLCEIRILWRMQCRLRRWCMFDWLHFCNTVCR